MLHRQAFSDAIITIADINWINSMILPVYESARNMGFRRWIYES